MPDLQALFETAGMVATINIVRDRVTAQARGFAFIEMNDDEVARRLLVGRRCHCSLVGRSSIAE